jgi:lysozyme family protein
MTYFYEIIPWVLKHEGGYVDNPDDPGGATNFGICERFLKNLKNEPLAKVHPKNLSKQDAITLYKKYFWDAYRFEGLSSKRSLSFHVFDIGINIGPHNAIKDMQKAYNTIHPDKRLEPDGFIGRRTEAYLQDVEEQPIVDAFKAIITAYDKLIIKYKPYEGEFLRGWLQRLNDPIPEESLNG